MQNNHICQIDFRQAPNLRCLIKKALYRQKDRFKHEIVSYSNIRNTHHDITVTTTS